MDQNSSRSECNNTCKCKNGYKFDYATESCLMEYEDLEPQGFSCAECVAGFFFFATTFLINIWGYYKDRRENGSVSAIIEEASAAEYEKYKLEQMKSIPTLGNADPSDNMVNDKSFSQTPPLIPGDGGEATFNNGSPIISQTKRPVTPQSEIRQIKTAVTLTWPSLFLKVFLRTHSLIKIFAFKSQELSRKARAIIYSMKFHLGLFALSATTYYRWDLMPSLLQTVIVYIAILPLSWPIELLLRYKSNTKINYDKLASVPARVVGEIQARIYEKLKFQNRLRAGARYIGYSITAFSFAAMSYFYAMLPLSAGDGAIYQIGWQALYVLTIHEVIQTGLQIGLILFAGARRNPALSQQGSTINKLAQFFVLKEVLEAFL